MKTFVIFAALAASVSFASAKEFQPDAAECYQLAYQAQLSGKPRPVCMQMYFPNLGSRKLNPKTDAAEARREHACWQAAIKAAIIGHKAPACAVRRGIDVQVIRMP